MPTLSFLQPSGAPASQPPLNLRAARNHRPRDAYGSLQAIFQRLFMQNVPPFEEVRG